MKKMTLLLTSLCLCGTLLAGNEIVEQKTVKVGQAFRVSMESKPSTGMRWRLAKRCNPLADSIRMTCITKSVTDPYYEESNTKGEEIWTFRANSAGTDTLTLYYKSHWGIQPMKVKKVCLTILPD